MAFKKGHPRFGGIKKGQKHQETLLKEERRAIFDEEISQVWRKKIHEMRAEYIGDQFMGKVADTMKIEYDMTDPHLQEIHEQLIELRRHKKSEGT